jgi:hypothetical protein
MTMTPDTSGKGVSDSDWRYTVTSFDVCQGACRVRDGVVPYRAR